MIEMQTKIQQLEKEINQHKQQEKEITTNTKTFDLNNYTDEDVEAALANIDRSLAQHSQNLDYK